MEFAILDVGESIKHLQEKMALSAEAAVDNKIPLAEIQADIFRIEESIFSSGGRRGGGSWKQLKPDTIKRKNSATILVQTGALKDSVTQPGAQFQILDISNDTLVFGTERPFAYVQQYGSDYKNRPARPFIRFLPNDINRWNGMILRHLVKAFAT